MRLPGILNTGALQQCTYLYRIDSAHRLPFRTPVVIGSELVGFSALWTLLRHGIRPRAMLETAPRVLGFPGSRILPALFGIPVHTGVNHLTIHGERHIEAIEFNDQQGKPTRLPCDGVVVSGRFVPENTTIRESHLPLCPISQGPRVDQFQRLVGHPSLFAAGNLLRAVESADRAYDEGVAAARWLREAHSGKLVSAKTYLPVEADAPLIHLLPQALALPLPRQRVMLSLRFTEPVCGQLVVALDQHIYWQQAIRVRAYRRYRIAVPLPREITPTARLRLVFRPTGGCISYPHMPSMK